MQQLRTPDGESRRPGSEGFFLPDFCAAPAVFFAVLLAELSDNGRVLLILLE